MKMFANKAPRGDPIITPSVSLYVHFVVESKWRSLCAHEEQFFQVFSCDFCFDELFVINLFEDDVNCIT